MKVDSTVWVGMVACVLWGAGLASCSSPVRNFDNGGGGQGDSVAGATGGGSTSTNGGQTQAGDGAVAGRAGASAEMGGSSGAGGAAGSATAGTGGIDTEGCDDGQKRCSDACVELDDPSYGCATPSCDPCSLPGVASAQCEQGACAVAECFPGLADCAADAEGCETDLTEAAHCGDCNEKCSGALGLCSEQSDGYACSSTCSGTETACGNDCADLSEDAQHCGKCETACDAPVGGNGVAVCASSKCGIECTAGYHECGNACKADTDATACGSSCKACPGPLTPAAGSAVCNDGSCGLACAADHHRCGDDCRPNDDAGACGPSCKVCGAAAPACVADECTCTGTVCGNTCVDTNEDANNCGACAHSCLGGSCEGGKCKAVTVATSQSQITHMILDDSHVYFAVELGQGAVDALRRAPLLGNANKTAEDLTLKADNTNALALNASTLFWSNLGSTQNLMSMPKGGGTATEFAASSSGAGIKLNATTVFWAHGSSPNGSIERRVIATGAATTMASPVDHPTGLAIDGANVYYSLYAEAGSIHKLPLGATVGNPAPTGLAFDQYYPSRLFVDVTNVYWMTGSQSGSVMKVPLTGGAPTPLYTSDNVYINDLVIDASHAYFTVGGSVMRVPLAGGAVETLASKVGAGRGLAVNATSVYFAGSSNVMRIAK